MERSEETSNPTTEPPSGSQGGAEAAPTKRAPTSMPPETDTVDDSRKHLDAFNWDELEQRLYAKQQEYAEREQVAVGHVEVWMKIFEAWAMAGTEHENDRARKRLRTRIEHVKGSEQSLEQRREHYVKVIEAFSSALEMLK